MGYRDDREALRQKNDDLEQELASARAELERMKDKPARAIEAAPPTSIEPGRVRRGGDKTLIGISVLLAAATGSALSAAGWVLVPLWVWVVASAVVSSFVARSVVVAGPHEAVVLAGRARRRADGSRVGYRVLHNARALRAAGEHGQRLDLSLFALQVLVRAAETKDEALLDVGLGVCAKIDADPLRLELAVERFRGREPAAVRDAVRQTVVDSARRVLVRVRADELRTHPKSVRHAIQEEVAGELSGLGVDLFALELLAFEPAETAP